MSHSNPPEQNWQPLNQLPLFASMIDEQVKDVHVQLQTLEASKTKPHVLDDFTVNRVLQVYGEQLDLIGAFVNKFEIWKGQSPNPSQLREIVRLEGQIDEIRQALVSILTLADELKQGTIDAILGKSDLEIAMDFLSGRLQPPS
jgi:hypothetical protein